MKTDFGREGKGKAHTSPPCQRGSQDSLLIRELSPHLEAYCLQWPNLRACREEVPFAEGQLPIGMVMASWGFLQRLGNP